MIKPLLQSAVTSHSNFSRQTEGFQMLTRRQCLTVAAAALAAPLAGRVRAQTKLPVVAFLHSQSAPPAAVEANGALQVRLRELGWEDGKTMRWVYAYTEGREDRLPGLAAGLVEQKVDVIVTAGGEAARAAKRATDTIPIVAVGPDLVAMGFAASFARPGGNITGPSLSAGTGISAKRLEVLKLALPAAKRITYVHNTQQTTGGTAQAVAAARATGLALSTVVVDNPADFDRAFAELQRNRPDATWWSDSPVNIQECLRIVEFGARERLPAVYGISGFAESGGLMSYGVSLGERARTAASYVDKILRDAKPGELPIEQASALELVLNLKAARAMGLVFPQALLVSTDRVIE